MHEHQQNFIFILELASQTMERWDSICNHDHWNSLELEC